MGEQRQTLTDGVLAELVRQLFGPLVLYAKQFCDCPEDAVQDAFLELQRNPPAAGDGGDSAMIHLRAWLFRTVRHRALNWQRTDQRRRRYESQYSQDRQWFSAPSNSSCDVDEAVAALQTLSEELRETVIARLWGNLTLEEIAELTEVSISTAQRRYIRGLEQLRQRLEQTERSPQAVPRKQS